MGLRILPRRRRLLLVAGLLVVCVVFVCFATLLVSPVASVAAAGEQTSPIYSAEEIAFVQLLNEYRASLGLAPLLVSDALSLACERHNSDMAKYRFFSHYTQASDWFAAGATPWDRMAQCGYAYETAMAENIAAGSSFSSAAKVLAAWQGSAGHDANMRSSKYKVVGISFLAADEGRYPYYWTLDFGGYVDPGAHSLGDVRTTAAGITSAAGSGSGDTGTGTGTGTVFTDVGPGTLYAREIALLAERGVVSGYGNGSFGPRDPVTRQQFAKMLARALELPVPGAEVSGFADVSDLSSGGDPLYPAGYIAACAAAGLTLGKEGAVFAPQEPLTRAQLITMVARAAQLPEPPIGYTPPFVDFSPDHYPWARKAAWAGLLDGLVGLGAEYDFWGLATRGEVCLLLARLLGL